jgi:hypothetical protein
MYAKEEVQDRCSGRLPNAALESADWSRLPLAAAAATEWFREHLLNPGLNHS